MRSRAQAADERCRELSRELQQERDAAARERSTLHEQLAQAQAQARVAAERELASAHRMQMLEQQMQASARHASDFVGGDSLGHGWIGGIGGIGGIGAAARRDYDVLQQFESINARWADGELSYPDIQPR